MIKLVLTDLDDTLIPVGTVSASPRALAAISAMLDAGLYFGPVSGRTPESMLTMFPENPQCYQTGAFANGQVIQVNGEIVKTAGIDAEELRGVIRYLDDNTKDAALGIFDILGTGENYYVTSDPARLAAIRGAYRRIGLERGELADGSYVKANIHCAANRARMLELRERLRAEFPQLDFVFPNSSLPLIDITPKNWNKGRAVEVFAQHLGISLDEIAVFGDSENDLSMLRAIPNSAAVANASDEVLEAAHWHIGDAADDAVAAALEDIAQAAPSGSMPAFMS